jgi:hypothetical protein
MFVILYCPTGTKQGTKNSTIASISFLGSGCQSHSTVWELEGLFQATKGYIFQHNFSSTDRYSNAVKSGAGNLPRCARTSMSMSISKSVGPDSHLASITIFLTSICHWPFSIHLLARRRTPVSHLHFLVHGFARLRRSLMLDRYAIPLSDIIQSWPQSPVLSHDHTMILSSRHWLSRVRSPVHPLLDNMPYYNLQQSSLLPF